MNKSKCNPWCFMGAVIALAIVSPLAYGVDITFDGGAGQVGGSCALVENGSARILVDCGSFYGAEAGPGDKSETGEFFFNPRTIDTLLVTHAHADHTGRIPQLIRSGFRGKIYMTSPTSELFAMALKSQALYDNSYVRNWEWSSKSEKAKVHWRRECKWRQKIKYSNLVNMRGTYSEFKKRYPDASGCKDCSDLDVADCMRHVQTVHYDEELAVGGFRIVFRPVEHLPGSAAIYFYGDGTSFLFSGDLGTWRSKLAKPVPPSSKVDAVFMECTYGDKARADKVKTANEYNRFASVVNDALAHGRLVWIPAFAMDRTQRVMLELVRCGAKPNVLYSLSSSGNEMTEYYLASRHLFPNDVAGLWSDLAHMHRNAKRRFSPGSDPAISAVLLTTSGMMDSGASYDFLKDLLPDPNVVLCLVGYQSPGTPGAQLRSGKKSIKLRNGQTVSVRATVESFDCFSGHGDARENDKWLGENVRSKIFLIHGDKGALEERKRGLETRFGSDVEIVQRNKTYHLGTGVK